MTWTFYAEDTLSGQIWGDLRVDAFKFAHVLNDFGQWSATVQFDPAMKFDARQATEPWRTLIHADRDGLIVGSCEIQSRSQIMLTSESFTIGGMMLGGWLDGVTIGGRNGAPIAFTAVDQMTAAKQLVDAAQAEWDGIGLTVLTPVASGVQRTIDWKVTDNKPYGEALKDIALMTRGFQWRVDTAWNGPTITRTLNLGYPTLGTQQPVYATHEDDGYGGYAGNILDVTANESNPVVTNVIVTGQGTGSSQLRATAVNDDVAGTYPRRARLDSISQSSSLSVVQDRADVLASLGRTAVVPWTFAIRGDDPQSPIGSYRVGDPIHVIVSPCVQFPQGFTADWTILQLDIDCFSAPEQVQITAGVLIS